jgi:hypothetical protein
MVLRGILMILCAGVVSMAGAQGFKMLYEMKDNDARLVIPGVRSYMSDPKSWEVDGKSTIVFMKTNEDSILFIDCATFKVKYHLKTKIEQQYIWPYGFFDVDGDNTKELLLSAYPDTGTGTPVTYWFIDAATQTVKYKMGILTPLCVVDINNDSYPEIICSDNSYWIQVWGNTKTSVQPFTQSSFLKKLASISNSPNPFREITRIEYYLPRKDNLLLRIFDPEGKLVRTLVNEQKDMGEYTVLWDGKTDNNSAVASGNYFYQLKIGDFVSSKRMIMVK